MSYYGMCIGGPRAGRMLRYQAPIYKVVEEQHHDFTSGTSAVAAEFEQKVFTYIHVDGIRKHGKEGFDFWVPFNGTLKDGWNVMFELINFYSKTHENLRRVGAQNGQ